jgi:phospholipase/carboxylesterase
MLDLRLAGRITFVHRAPTKEPLPAGLHKLGLYDERDYFLVVPDGLDPRKPVPFMVMFHGGGGSAERIMPVMKTHAEKEGFLLLVPQSLLPTWDIAIAGNGPDRERLENALNWVADRYALRPDKFAFAGHSDGGSYSLSTGVANGDFVTHILAFSAGFFTPLHQEGAPYIFIAHGSKDEKTPVETAGRASAKKLKDADYDVTYIEYDGPHASQPHLVAVAVKYFLNYPPPAAAAP